MKRIASLLPFVRKHYAYLEALQNEHASLASQLFASRSELERTAASLSACRTEFAQFRERFSPSRLGSFFPSNETPLTREEKEIVDRFHDLFYRLGQRGHYTNHVSWLGYSCLKCPLDLWIYHELISRLRPEFIIETGTASAGSALFLASMCDLVDHGQVITIDVDERPGERRPAHPRLSYLVGSSTDQAVIGQVRQAVAGKSCGMIILDSDHHRDHVLAEMRVFAEFVPVGGYLIVEDTNINGHPTFPEYGPGPMEAVNLFLAETDRFEIDATCERFLLTMNPSGFLRRRA